MGELYFTGVMIFFAIISLFFQMNKPKVTRVQLRRKETVLSEKEMELYKTLQELSVKNNVSVIPKVGVTNVLSIPTNTRRGKVLLRELRKTDFDFVLCHPGTMEALMVIEMYEKNMDSKKKRKELLKVEALRAAGILFITVNEQQNFNVVTLENQIVEKIEVSV